MSTLLYLRGRRLKNQLKSLIHKPARLLYVILIAACLVLTLVSGRAATLPGNGAFRDQGELSALAAAVYLLMFLLALNAGFSRGGNLFTMSDVNLLFPAPIRPQTVLFHGLLQQMAASLLLGFFLLFQYANLRMAYGIFFPQLLMLLAGYAAATFLGQVTAMLIYSFTNGNPRRQMLCRAVLGTVLGVLAAYLAWRILPGGRSEFLPSAVEALNGPVFRCLPVAGWLGLAEDGLLRGSAPAALAGFGLCAAYFAVLLAVIFRADPDYYEDVLKSAEIAQSAITAKKEGTMTEAPPQNVRVGKTGIRRGWGAQVFFYKHLLENRRGRRFLLSGTSLTMAAVVILFSAFMHDAGLLPTFLMSVYLQMFSAILGRFNQELTRPYLYLVPEPPMKKMLWALAETLPSAALEAAVVFLPVGAILGLSAGLTAVCVAARISFAMLYTAANVVVERLWGGVSSRVLVFFLFFVVTLGLAAPGVAVSLALADVSSGAMLSADALANAAASLTALFLCRNMLQYAELNNQ